MYTVYDREFGDFPAKKNIYTVYIYGSGQPYTLRTRHPLTHPLLCSSFRMDSASMAMQDTISCDMVCPCWFHRSHKLGPNMSMTYACANA